LSSYLPYLLTWMESYGYPVLWLSVFIAATGLPLPTTLILLAAGAFAALGDFSLFLLVPLAITASVCGDSIGYLLGRLVGHKLLRWLETRSRLRFLTPAHIRQARHSFERRGGWAIFLTRFLFSALGGITNILAGSDLYPYPRFLLYDIGGEILGALIPLSLGFAFGASWEAVGDILGALSGLTLALTLVFVLLVLLLKSIRSSIAEKEAQRSSTRPMPAGVEVMRSSTDSLPP
jgi:membrane-associated protein